MLEARACGGKAVLGLALCALCLLGAARPAHAERAVLLPPRGDDTLVEAQQLAHAELARVLVDQGVSVVEPAQVAAAEGGSAAECQSVDCAPQLLRAADADVAAAIAVWSAASGEGAGTVFVTLVDRSGARFPGKAEVKDADVAAAARDALLDARSLQLLGPGPWLRVSASVEGAEVVLDGELVGSTPYRAPITSGRHALEVRAPGHRPHVQTVDIPPNAARQVEVSAELGARDPGPTELGGGAELSGGGDSSWVGPVLLGGAGAGLLVADLAFVLSAGCVERLPGGTCRKNKETNTGMAIAWGGVGVAAIAGAILWYALDADTESAQDDLQLGVGPDGLRLTGRF